MRSHGRGLENSTVRSRFVHGELWTVAGRLRSVCQEDVPLPLSLLDREESLPAEDVDLEPMEAVGDSLNP